MADPLPTLRSIVLDCEDARALAEFYRQLLGWSYLPGDEPDEAAPDTDWLVLLPPSGWPRLAFQQVPSLPRPTWPTTDVPQQAHLDFQVETIEELRSAQALALSLGAQLLEDRSDDPDEKLVVDVDPAGHPFCIFVPAD